MNSRKATDTIFVHCAATKSTMDIGVEEIRRWHKDRGWEDIGYHWVIRRDGTVEVGRPEGRVGAHVAGHNARSVGICLVGGLSRTGRPEYNFTTSQMVTLRRLIQQVMARYLDIKDKNVLGHRDVESKKDCPCFDVQTWWNKT